MARSSGGQLSDEAANGHRQPSRQQSRYIFHLPSIPSERGEHRNHNLFSHPPVVHSRAYRFSTFPPTHARQLGEGRLHSMADLPQSPLKHEESATTREEMDFDDNEHEHEHEQEHSPVSPLAPDTPTLPTTSPARKNVSFQEPSEEAPPIKPPRPLSPQQQAENTLIEAFPSIDTKVVKAVLMASGGQVEPAFNALLGMSDPDFTPEHQQAAAPLQTRPPRPLQQRAPMTQLEADELYARQLAEQYNSTTGAPRAQNRYNQREPARRAPNQQQPLPRRPSWAEDDNERNFFDDELPEFGRTIQQGFLDTQKKVNSWIANFKKRIDGEEVPDDDDEDLYTTSQSGSRVGTNQSAFAAAGGGGGGGGRQNFGPSQSAQLHGIQKQAEAQQRRSAEANRYDSDPHVLGEDEFSRLELRDEEEEEAPPNLPPRTSSRPQAATGGRAAPNPDLFKSGGTAPKRPPQAGPVDEVEAAGEQPADSKAKKWQPLTSVAPHPEDEENDPFSVGDEEEGAGGGELRKEDSARLKEAARSSVGGGAAAGGGESKGVLEEAGRSGSQNQEALELLGGKGE